MEQASLDFLDVPVLAVSVLDPLVVADRHTPRVCEHVWDHRDPTIAKNRFPRRVDRAVRAFRDQTNLECVGFLLANLIFERRGYEEVGFGFEELSAGDPLATSIAFDRAAIAHVLLKLVCVEAFLVA